MSPADLARWFSLTPTCINYWLANVSEPTGVRRSLAERKLDVLERHAARIRADLATKNRAERVEYVRTESLHLLSEENTPAGRPVLSLLERGSAADPADDD
jgi:hypothetical protein